MNFPKSLLLSAFLTSKSFAAVSSTDLWDISQGSIVTSSSQMGYGAASNMFGDNQVNPSYPIEAGNALFQDWYPAGYVHWVEWKSLAVIHLSGYNLVLANDLGSGNRGLSIFSLYGRLSASDPWQLLDSFSPSIHPYAPYEFSPYEHSGSFDEFKGLFFRAEFTQYAPIYGVRVPELDAIATVPEASLSVLVVAFSSLGLLRRKRPQS
jgi:hypothetical protein